MRVHSLGLSQGLSCSLESQVTFEFLYFCKNMFFNVGNEAQNDKWLHNEIYDDPVKGTNTRGTISFATAGPDTRTSQVFINYINNSRLDEMGFAPFGEVVVGLETAYLGMFQHLETLVGCPRTCMSTFTMSGSEQSTRV